MPDLGDAFEALHILKEDEALLKGAYIYTPSVIGREHIQGHDICFLHTKCYVGARYSKESQNFLWDME